MKKYYKLLTLTTVCTLSLGGLSSFSSLPRAHAANMQEIQQQRSNIQSQVNEKNQTNKSLEEQAIKIRNEIKQLDSQLAETTQKLTDKQTEVDQTRQEIEKLKAEITELEKRIAERDKLLKDRVVTIQQSGGAVNYLEVLLGSEDFSDFLDRANALNLIVKQDKEILETQKREKALVEQKKQQVTDKLTQIEKDLNDLQALNQQLNQQREQKNNYMASLTDQQRQVQAEIASLDKEVDMLDAAEKAIKAQIAQAEKQAQSSNQSNSGGSTASSAPAAPAVGQPSDVPSNTGGFIRPASGTFTSGFGSRWGKLHAGVDIANAAGTPILAAASGRVVMAGQPMRGYGNMVMIRHNINGKTYDTLYGHMSSLSVSVGQTVSQGQVIGGMGSTGDSTGNHLHFEIHPGGYKHPVDPMPYIR